MAASESTDDAAGDADAACFGLHAQAVEKAPTYTNVAISIFIFWHWLKQPNAPPGNCASPWNEVGGLQPIMLATTAAAAALCRCFRHIVATLGADSNARPAYAERAADY
jgi:hypothetical protein